MEHLLFKLFHLKESRDQALQEAEQHREQHAKVWRANALSSLAGCCLGAVRAALGRQVVRCVALRARR